MSYVTRGYVHPEYSVKKMKILIVKSKMTTVLKLSIFDFCDFWIATFVSKTCMHGSNFFTLPGPVRSEAKVCSCAVCMCYRSRPVVPNLWPAGQTWPSRFYEWRVTRILFSRTFNSNRLNEIVNNVNNVYGH